MYFSRTMTTEEERNIPPPSSLRPQSPPPAINKLSHGINSGGNAAGKQSDTTNNGCPNSCGDCNTFFTDIIFPPTATNQAEDTVEATVLSQKAVDIIPVLSLLDKNLSFPTACSFASTLTQSSDDMKPKDELIGRRLTLDERKAALDNCRSLRLQISNFEANFTMEHGRIPTTSTDKAPLVDIYAQYREGKRCIRSDAACRIQAACRGAIVRMRASKKSAQARAEAFVDALLETTEMEDASLLTTQMIDKYLTTEERKKVATKVLSEKLYNHKDQLALATPANAKGGEYMCEVCEMPKLCSKNGIILRKCEVCPAINKKIVQKKKDEKKSSQLMDMEKKKLAYEKDKLQQLKQQMEVERKRITAKDEQFAEKKVALLASASASTSGSTNRNVSKSSILREPLEVRARKRFNKMKAAKASGGEASENNTTEYGFGQDSFSNIINNLRADLKNVVRVTDTNFKTTTRTDAVEGKAVDEKNDEKDEDDNLIDDPEITHMQRKIRFCPSPHPSGGQTAPQDCVSKQQHVDNDEVDEGKSYGGFANKAEYDKFQDAFGEFEREHEGIIEYMRQKVGHRDRDRGNKATRHARSSGVQSVSSDDDSREFERRGRHNERDNYHGRRRGHRHHDDYRDRRGTRRHGRGQKYQEYDSDSMSSESSYPDYQRRRTHSSRSRRNFYVEKGKCDRGYDHDRRYSRPRERDCRDYYRDAYDYEPRRRGHERPSSRREHRRDDYDYIPRRRGQHRAHDDHSYTSHFPDSDQEFLDIDHRARHSRYDDHAKDERIPKPNTLTKPLGLN